MTKEMIFLIIAIIAIAFISGLVGRKTKSTPSNSKAIYKYKLRKHIMTLREEDFFKRLNSIFQSKCYVIPQANLQSFLYHEIKGQNWNGAFQHINRKTVDYLLLSRKDNSVICAIELDDSTHDSMKRKARDQEVERILSSVELPLVRFRNISNISDKDILDEVVRAIKLRG